MTVVEVPVRAWRRRPRADGDRLVANAAQMVFRDPAMDHHAAVVIALREHFAVSRQIRQQPAVVDARFDVHIDEIAAQGVADRRGQLRQPKPSAGADRNRVGIAVAATRSSAAARRRSILLSTSSVSFSSMPSSSSTL